MTSTYVDNRILESTICMLESAANNCTDASIGQQLMQQASELQTILTNAAHIRMPISQDPQTQLQVAAIIADRDLNPGIVTGRFSAASPNESNPPKSGIPVITPEYVPARFPCMIRKMWSGGEVQTWLDENKAMVLKPAYRVDENGKRNDGYGDPAKGEYNAFLADDGSDLPCD